MDFGANKTPIVIRAGAFGGTYFRDIYSRSCTKNRGKNLIS